MRKRSKKTERKQTKTKNKRKFHSKNYFRLSGLRYTVVSTFDFFSRSLRAEDLVRLELA